VRAGEALVTLYYNDPSRVPEAERLILEGYQITDEAPGVPPLIREVIR